MHDVALMPRFAFHNARLILGQRRGRLEQISCTTFGIDA